MAFFGTEGKKEEIFKKLIELETDVRTYIDQPKKGGQPRKVRGHSKMFLLVCILSLIMTALGIVSFFLNISSPKKPFEIMEWCTPGGGFGGILGLLLALREWKSDLSEAEIPAGETAESVRKQSVLRIILSSVFLFLALILTVVVGCFGCWFGLVHMNDARAVVVKIEDSDCVHSGEAFYRCRTCGEEWTEAIPLKDHTDDGGVITKHATCTEEGIITHTCTVCGAALPGQTIPATGHKDDGGVVTKHATCTEEGIITHTCTVCGTVLPSGPEDRIPATGHKDDGGVVTKHATCTEDGVITHTCTVCGAAISGQTIPATGHTNDEGVVTLQPTCTETGIKTHTCKTCGATLPDQIIPAKGHTKDEGVVTKKSSCTENGIKTHKCTECGADLPDELLPLEEHTDDGGVVTKKSTCTENGIKTHKCTECGAALQDELLPLAEHTDDGGSVIKQSTCAETGVKLHRCKECKASLFEESLPLTDHTLEVSERYWEEDGYVASTKTSYAVIPYSCSVCPAKFTAEWSTENFSFTKSFIRPEDKNHSDVSVMFDASAHYLVLNLADDYNSALNEFKQKSLYDASNKVLTISSGYGNSTVKTFKLIGNPNMTSELCLTTKSLSELNLILQNLTLRAPAGYDGIDLRNVSKATIEIVGSVSVSGKNGIEGKELTIFGGDRLEIMSSDGASGANGSGYGRWDYGKGYRNGTNGSDGTEGGSGIRCTSLSVDGALELFVTAGKGGDGGNGGDGGGSNDSDTSRGGNGGAGGKGGDGGSAIYATSSVGFSEKVKIVVLKPGNGGNGGAGGGGGHGQDTNRRDSGGNGGAGGAGGNSGVCIAAKKITAQIIVDLYPARGGNGGAGGAGGNAYKDSVKGRWTYIGNGGAGGAGGDAVILRGEFEKFDYSFRQSACAGDGGNGGAAGGGGSGIGAINNGTSGNGGNGGRVVYGSYTSSKAAGTSGRNALNAGGGSGGKGASAEKF